MSGRCTSEQKDILRKRVEEVLVMVFGAEIADFVPSIVENQEYMNFLEMLKDLFQVEKDYAEYLDVINQREKAVNEYNKKLREIFVAEVTYKNAALAFYNCSAKINSLSDYCLRICQIYSVDRETCRLACAHIHKMNVPTNDLRRKIFLKNGRNMIKTPMLFETLAQRYYFKQDRDNIKQKITDAVKNHCELKIEISEILQTIQDCDDQLLEFRSS